MKLLRRPWAEAPKRRAARRRAHAIAERLGLDCGGSALVENPHGPGCDILTDNEVAHEAQLAAARVSLPEKGRL